MNWKSLHIITRHLNGAFINKAYESLVESLNIISMLYVFDNCKNSSLARTCAEFFTDDDFQEYKDIILKELAVLQSLA